MHDIIWIIRHKTYDNLYVLANSVLLKACLIDRILD